MIRKEHYKDLSKWRETKRRQKTRYYKKTQGGKNSRARWTIEEINMVMEHKITDTELAGLIGRSVASIQVMRCKMKEKGSTKMSD